jgi:uncharacterized protein
MSASEIEPPSSVRVEETRHGRGVVAATDISKGETIETCPVLVLGEGDASGILDDYVVSLGDEVEGTALMLGYGSLYNHSEEPNAEYLWEADDVYSFVALRDIAAGEEITITYGEDWWETRDEEPSPPAG